jgi:triacylglycerol lipase
MSFRDEQRTLCQAARAIGLERRTRFQVMSFLTTFPEDVYPTRSLAETIQTEVFDIVLAQALMWMSQAAYETTADASEVCEKCKLERILERWGFVCRARLSQGGTEGFVAESETTLVVAFAGTDPVIAANWITDFNIRTGPDGVHRGFSDGVACVGPALIAALAGTTKHIFLVGHSLGGALAVVAAWRLTADGWDFADWIPPDERIDLGRIAGVVTYGMPRAGDEAFEAAYRSRGLWQKTARLEYGNDIIPSLPPAAIGQLAFRHVGPALHCPHGGQFKDSLPPRDDPDDRIELAQLEELIGITNRETLHNIRDAWDRILDHGVPRSPAGGMATLIIDRLPFFLRDHVQDCYLEALGWSFARSSEPPVSISADDADAFAHASEIRIAASGGGLSALLRRLLSSR